MERFDAEWGYGFEMANYKGLFNCSLLVILPGKKIGKHYHKKLREVEIILEGEGLLNGEPISSGKTNVWEPGQQHEYVNNGGTELKILCISMPDYDPKDEIYL